MTHEEREELRKITIHAIANAFKEATPQMLTLKRERDAVLAQVAALREALSNTEKANDAIAGARTVDMYLAMIDSGQGNLFDDLDSARRNSRFTLANTAQASQDYERRIKEPLEARIAELEAERDKREQDAQAITDTERLDWIERGGLLRRDPPRSLFGEDLRRVFGFWTIGPGPNRLRPRYWTAREAIDAAIREGRA